MTLTQAPTVPSVWKIVRTYLAAHESADLKQLIQQVRRHRPNISTKVFYGKIFYYKKRGDIEPGKTRGVYKLTGQGSRDISDPYELVGLRTSVPIKTGKRESTPDVAIQLPKRAWPSAAHMAMMRQKRAEKQAAKRNSTTRDGKPVQSIKIAGKQVHVDEELIARLLKRQGDLLPTPEGQIINLPIGIRLKVTVEVV